MIFTCLTKKYTYLYSSKVQSDRPTTNQPFPLCHMLKKLLFTNPLDVWRNTLQSLKVCFKTAVKRVVLMLKYCTEGMPNLSFSQERSKKCQWPVKNVKDCLYCCPFLIYQKKICIGIVWYMSLPFFMYILGSILI